MVIKLILPLLLSMAVNAAAPAKDPKIEAAPAVQVAVPNLDALLAKYKVSKIKPPAIEEGEIIVEIKEPKKPGEEPKENSYCVVHLNILKKYFEICSMSDFSDASKGEPYLFHEPIAFPDFLNFMNWLEAIDSGHQVAVPHITYNLAKFIDYLQFSKKEPCYSALYTEIARYLLDPEKVDLLEQMTDTIYYDCISIDLPGEIAQKAVALWKVAKDSLKSGHPLFNLAISYEDALSNLDFHQKYVVTPEAWMETPWSYGIDKRTKELSHFLRKKECTLVVDCGHADYVPDSFLAFYAKGIMCAEEIIFIGDNVTHLGSSCLTNYRALFSITLPRRLTHIGGAFLGGSSIESFTLPPGVIQVGDFFLSNCRQLKSVTLPPNLQIVEFVSDYRGFLSMCDNLQDIFVPENSQTEQLLNTDDRFKDLRPKIKRIPAHAVAPALDHAAVEHQVMGGAPEHVAAPRQIQFMADPNPNMVIYQPPKQEAQEHKEQGH